MEREVLVGLGINEMNYPGIRCANVEEFGGHLMMQAKKFQHQRFILGRSSFCAEAAQNIVIESSDGTILAHEARLQHQLILMALIHYCAAVANDKKAREGYDDAQKQWHTVFDELRNSFAAHDDGEKQLWAPFAFFDEQDNVVALRFQMNNDLVQPLYPGICEALRGCVAVCIDRLNGKIHELRAMLIDSMNEQPLGVRAGWQKPCVIETIEGQIKMVRRYQDTPA